MKSFTVEQDWLFIPPSYFDVLTTALKSMHIPPTWGSSPIDVLPSLQLKLDTIHRPTSFSSGNFDMCIVITYSHTSDMCMS